MKSKAPTVTFYRWRKNYSGPKADQLKRLKELEKAEVAPVSYISPGFRGLRGK